MKKKVLAFFAGLILILGSAGIVSAAPVDVWYDGYCDGMHFDYNQATGLVDGYQTGSCIGSGSYTFGTVGSVFSQGPAVTMSYDDLAIGVGLMTVIRPNRTWTHYANDGSGIYVFNSGTWSPGIPPQTEDVQGLPNSVGR